VTLAASGCPAGQLALESGCADAALSAEKVRGAVRDAMAELDLRSAIVSVSVGDTPVLTQAWGESAPGQPATVDMHWRNGSIAIAYLTTALLQLQDQGVLGLDDKLSKWLPDYPRASDITLRMLANSTSGYADYVDLNVLPLYDDVHRQWSQDELIHAALAQPMKCAPGTCFSYSHANFVILGRVMSMASGKPVADLIRTGILEPLGMRETRSDSTAFIPAPVLHAFNVDRGQYEDSTDWSPSWTIAEGAIMTSTVADVMRSAPAIATGQLISPKAYAQLVEPTTAAFSPQGKARYYGLGIFVSNGWLLQNPFFFGYSGLMAYLPAQKIAIAVTSTLGPRASPDGNMSDLLFRRIVQRLTPSHMP
jgi:CubicO group peptidase (beta-lactamase class C family)